MRLNASLHVTPREFRSPSEKITWKMFSVFVSVWTFYCICKSPLQDRQRRQREGSKARAWQWHLLKAQQKCCLWRFALCLLVSLYKKRKPGSQLKTQHRDKKTDKRQRNWYVSTNGKAHRNIQLKHRSKHVNKMHSFSFIAPFTWHTVSLIILVLEVSWLKSRARK